MFSNPKSNPLVFTFACQVRFLSTCSKQDKVDIFSRDIQSLDVTSEKKTQKQTNKQTKNKRKQKTVYGFLNNSND